MYNPGVGRWITRDPLVGVTKKARVTSNLYSYVNSMVSAINITDPTGLSWDENDILVEEYDWGPLVPEIQVLRWNGPLAHQFLVIDDGHLYDYVFQARDANFNPLVDRAGRPALVRYQMPLIVGFSGLGGGTWGEEMGYNHPQRDANLWRLQRPADYLTWDVRKLESGFLGVGSKKPCCKVDDNRELVSCVVELMNLPPRNPMAAMEAVSQPAGFDLLFNNCRMNSDAILKKCCMRRGKLSHNPENTTDLGRFFRDVFGGPGQSTNLANR